MANKFNNKKTGDLGESIAAKYLKGKGLKILDRNYYKKWGEIDIVARGTSINNQELNSSTNEVVHFIEVKSVSYETKSLLNWAVTHETWRPEELVHQFKLNQIRKAVETWVIEHNWAGAVQLDVITVRMVPREKYASINHIENVVLEQ